MSIDLHPDVRKELQAMLRAFLNEELEPESEIGDLKASIVLDFVIEQLGPGIYNQALADLQSHVMVRMSDAVDALLQAPPK